MLTWTNDRDIFAWRKSSNPPPFLEYRSSKWFILFTVSVAVFTDLFLYAVIVPVIPFALTQRAGVPQENVQHWVSSLLACYGAALLAASPVCGWLADHSKSRRLPLVLGLLALAGATVMLLLGSNIGVLVAGRLLQGLSGAVVWVAGLALLVDTVGQQDIGQVMGYVLMSLSMAILLGPLLGGVVYAKVGYYAVYYMAFGLIGLDAVLRLVLVEKKVAKKWDKDLSNASDREISKFENGEDEKITPTAVTGVSAAPLDVPSEKLSSLPPVLTLLASPRLLTALWCTLVQAALFTAFDSVLPLRVKAIFHWSSTGAGLIFLPLLIPSFVAPLAGWVSDKYGPRYLTALGLALNCPSLVLLRYVTHESLKQIVLLCGLLVLLGFTLTLVMTPLLAEITYEVEAKEKAMPGRFGASGAYAQAYGLWNCAFACGTLVGPIWAGFINAKAGWGTMSWSLALLSAFSVVPAFIYTGGYLRTRHLESARWGHNVAREVEQRTGV